MVRKYPTYKDSGIAWIGAIPEGWNIQKVKSAFDRKKDTCNNANPVILSLTSKGVKFRDITTNEGQIAASYENYNPVFIGDILLNPMDLVTNAFSAVSDKEGVISPAYVNLRARNGYFNKYYDYYFKLQYWGLSFFAHGKGVSFENRWTLNNETLMNYFIPVPRYSEQKAIADYLDKKCAAIDKTIETEEKVIEKLKEYKQSLITETVTKGLDKSAPMKDSGIPWIGQIPQHWEVGKVVYFFGVTLGKMLQPTQKEVNETLKNYLCAANLGGNQLKIGTLKQMWFSQREKEEYTIKKNDLLVVEGGDIASCDIVPHDLPGVYFQNSILRVRPKGNMSVKILRYLLHVAKWTGHIDLICNKATIAHFTKEKLSNLACLKIPASEQQAIVKYLDDKCAKIDKSIADKEQVIEKLTEYKKSLIYECVTGKRMVA